jgi:hypothetical protein
LNMNRRAKVAAAGILGMAAMLVTFLFRIQLLLVLTIYLAQASLLLSEFLPLKISLTLKISSVSLLDSIMVACLPPHKPLPISL